MKGFSEIISVDRQDLFFSFTPFTGNEHLRYSVTVALTGSSSITFEMKQLVNGHWDFNKAVPGWIVKLQPQLTQAICSNP